MVVATDSGERYQYLVLRGGVSSFETAGELCTAASPHIRSSAHVRHKRLGNRRRVRLEGKKMVSMWRIRMRGSISAPLPTTPPLAALYHKSTAW